MTGYFRAIIRYRWILLIVIALATLAGAAIMSQGVVASSIGHMFLGESPAYQRYLNRLKQFGGNDVLIIAVEEPSPMAAEKIDALRYAIQKITGITGIKNVRSILDAQHIQGMTEGLNIYNYTEQTRREPEKAEFYFRQLREDPLVGGLLISDDGKTHAVIIEMDAESDIPAEQAPIILDEIFAAFHEQGYPRSSLHVAGFPADIAAIIGETYYNFNRLFPIVCLVLLVTVWLMFRRFWPVALTIAVAMISVVITMGFSVLLDRQISVLTSMIPAVILIISFSDVIHLCSAYLLELGRGVPKEEAILASGADVGKACLLTSLTTFLGFVAMSFVPAPAFRHMGVVLGFGVAVALLLAVTLTPILFSIIPTPKPWRAGATGHVQDLLDRFLVFTDRLTGRHPKSVVAFFLILFIASGIGAMQFHIDTDFGQRLSKNNPIRRDGEFVQANFAGANAVELYLDAREQDGLLDADRFARIDALQQATSKMPGIKRVHSLVDLIELLHREMTYGLADAGRLPQSRAALAQYLLLFEMSGGEDLERLIDSRRQIMRLVMQLPDTGVRDFYKAGENARAKADELLGGHVSVEPSGLSYLMGQWLDEIIAGQRRGLLFALLTIAATMAVGLRSLRMGLWSMVPNVLPLLALAGYLGFTMDKVDSDIMGIMMIAIGIGVDDTIHFLTRLRIERTRQNTLADAVHETLHFSGRGIVITSIILVCGFAPFAASDYYSLHIMGTLLPMTLIVALVADLFFIPALVHLKVMGGATDDNH